MRDIRVPSEEIEACRTIHFGKNPKKGGNPPKDSRFNRLIMAKTGGILKEESWLIC